MKKVFGIAITCLIMATLSTSCHKTCTCKTYLDGNLVSIVDEMSPGDSRDAQCSDLNKIDSTNNGKINGIICE